MSSQVSDPLPGCIGDASGRRFLSTSLSSILSAILTVVALVFFTTYPSQSQVTFQCSVSDDEDRDDCLGGVCDPTVAVVYVTYESVLLADGSSPYMPQWADSLAGDLESWVDSQANGFHNTTIRVIKRVGADSTKYWLSPYDVDEETILDVHSALRDSFPAGALDGVRGIIWISTARHESDSDPFSACGCLCMPSLCSDGADSARIHILNGYLQGDQWHSINRWLVQMYVFHEYAHWCGADHLLGAENGDATGCTWGKYYACYDIMHPASPGGCPSALDATHRGMVPLSPYNLKLMRWLDVDTLATDQTNYTLEDVRRSGAAAQINTTDPEQFFLLVNHQDTDADAILNGRGLLIWHIKRAYYGTCDGLPGNRYLIDLEHASGKWQRDSGAYCRKRPLVADAAAGVDTLDCTSAMRPTAFYAGVSTGGWTPPTRFDGNSNPSSRMYPTGSWQPDLSRLSTQSTTSGISISQIRSYADPQDSTKYVIEFDLDMP